jgi:hypothetical protein
MKKGLLLLAAGLVAITSEGQYLQHNTSAIYTSPKKTAVAHVPAPGHIAAPAHHSGARTTSSLILSEDFGTGSFAALPTGWTTGTLNVGTWKWMDRASTSQFTMGAMTSTTAANGWMIFDSDSIGAATSGTPAGWLQSPSYNLAAHPHVGLVFQDYYRKYNDSCFVWVSTSPTFTTYTKFPVALNNTIPTNVYSANPATVNIDISSVAGGQPSVYIRFVTYGPSLGAYSWMIDDMNLMDPDSVDAGISKASVVYFSGSDVGFYSFGAMPSKLVDSVFPEVFVANYGFTPLPALPVSAQIFQGLSSVYTSSINVNATVNAFDSLADFTQATPSYYYSNTVAQYTVPFSVNPATDAITANNKDTARFMITDSTWSENGPGKGITGQYYVYHPGLAQSPATMFSIPAGQNDTLTSVSVTFGSSTKAGQVVGVQIYHFDGVGWIYDGTTEFRALTATDISTQGVFMVNTTGGLLVLQGNTGGVLYAAALKGSGNTDTVTVLESENAAPGSIMSGDSPGLFDSSLNDGPSSHLFGNPNLPSPLSYTPFIDLNFGVVVIDRTGINDLTAGNDYIGSPYPNPANTAVYIPFTMSSDAMVTITLSDVVGQVLRTQTVHAAGGRSVRASIATGDLAAGIYLYTLQANGATHNGRIVISH